MAEITDAERDTLNRLLADDESDMTVDDLLRLPAGAVSMFRRLAESQQALGEIADKKPYGVKTEFGEHDCYQCVKLIRIAHNARRGGKK